MYYHCIYAPVVDSERGDFFASLPRDFPVDAYHVILGDFNVPLDRTKDCADRDARLWPGHDECVLWLTDLGSIDVWRHRHPRKRVFSGPRAANRLDYVCASQELVHACYNDAKYLPVIPKVTGDHMPLAVSLRNTPVPRRAKGYWKMPMALLKINDVVEAIRNEANDLLTVLRGGVNNPGVVWCGWKKRVKTFLDEYQGILHMDNKIDLAIAQRDLNEAKRAFRLGLGNDDSVSQATSAYNKVFAEWKQQRRDDSYELHHLQNETSSRHFFRAPTATMQAGGIGAVDMPDGSTSTDADDISSTFRSWWERIMRDPAPPQVDLSARQSFIDVLTPRLTPEDQADLDMPISAMDLAAAIRTMPPDKAPGMDGFPNAFFQLEPDTFGEILAIVFAAQKERPDGGELLLSQRQSAIVLLHKGGSTSNPGNYRPIALMPVETKLLSRALAHRLGQVLPQLIHEDQKGFVLGRSIHDHVVQLQELQHLLTRLNLTGYATFLDFEKAYDRVDWAYLTAVLERFGIGPQFISWVKVLYKKTIVRLDINGTLSAPIVPNRGVKQGDPLSSLLFVLAIEPLAEHLRRSPHLGIEIPYGPRLTSQLFADDCTLLSPNYNAVQGQMRLVDQYCAVSGAKLNVAKCKVVLLNDQEEPTPWPDLTLLSSGNYVKYLGVWFGHRLAPHCQVDGIVQAFYSSFATWGFRARTLAGRRLIVQNKVLPRLWYYTTTLAVPPATVEAMQSMVSKFILRAKLFRHDRYICTARKGLQFDPEAGLRFPHVASIICKQRLRMLQRMSMPTDPAIASWRHLAVPSFAEALGTMGRPDLWDFLWYAPNQRTTVLELKAVSPLLRDVWQHWHKIPWEKKFPTGSSMVNVALDAPIWLNNHKSFLANRTTTALSQPLVLTLPTKHRPWYFHIAAEGITCLRSLLQGNNWPSPEDFDQLMQVCAATYDGRPPTSFGWLYNRLEIVARQLWTLTETPWGQSLPATPTSHLVWPIVTTSGTRDIAMWPKTTIYKLASSRPCLDRDHPFKTAERPTKTAVKKYIKTVHQARANASPVEYDVWFRCLYNLLPTNARTWFVGNNPSSVTCSYPTCMAPETSEHLMFQCDVIAPLWAWHAGPWAALGLTINWNSCVNLDEISLAPEWEVHRNAVVRLFHGLICVCFHQIWKHRNAAKHEGAPAPFMPALQQVSLLRWTSHVRLAMRQAPPDDAALVSVPAILATLTSHVNYHEVHRQHPLAFATTAPT